MILAALALAWAASPTFAQSASENAPATTAGKAEKADGADKSDTSDKAADKADKADKSDKAADKADKAAKSEKGESNGEKSEKDGATKADGGASGQATGAPAQPAQPGQPAKPAPAGATEERDDMVFKPAQPDFTLISLPTGLRLPKFKSALRVTHRFSRPLGQGSFGDLASDLFAFDSAAQIGLEFRFGLWTGWQVGIHRTSDRDIQFFTQYDLFQQSARLPFGLAAIATLDGTNNFRASTQTDANGNTITHSASKSPGVGAIVSRTFGKYGALYFEPIYVNNTNPLPKELVDHNDTFFIGIGGRVQVHKDVYIVAEATPRAAGYKPGVNGGGFGFEKHVGGHVFQLNFGKGFGTTMAQIARGGPASNDWFIGFNLTRKFF
jgi:hypothetical protein